MPNWIINKLTFEGSTIDISNVLQLIATREESIDFEKIVSRPKELSDVDSDSISNILCALVHYLDDGDETELLKEMESGWIRNILERENISTVDECAKYLLNLEQYSKKTDVGIRALKNEELYGHRDWYTWSLEHWGTKWNTSDTYTTSEGEIVFQTAWSTPYPVIKKLSEQNSELLVKLRFADESIGENCGEYHLKAGVVVYEQEYDEVEACILWDYDPYELFDYMQRDKNINDILEDDNTDSSL